MKRLALPVSLALLLAWQAMFYRAGVTLDGTYHGAGVGLCPDLANFFPFLFHGYGFPIGSADLWKYGAGKDDVAKLVSEDGKSLVNALDDIRSSSRFGDAWKVLLFYPTAWWRGSAAAPAMQPTNVAAFMFALSALLIALWSAGRPVLGVSLVLLLGSNPLQLWEVYGRENVFGWPITIAVILMALHVRMFTRPPERRMFLAAALSGILVACAREIRSEAAVVGVAVPIAYLTLRASWLRRGTMVCIFLLAFALTAHAWSAAYDRSFASARAFVATHGGRPYRGPYRYHHPRWHAVFCGLGDFDHGRHGYLWLDPVPFAYAHPILWDRYHIPLTLVRGDYFAGDTMEGGYRRSFFDYPEYDVILRDKILGDIWNDPGWYIRGLWERTQKISARTVPVSVAVGSWRRGVYVPGWLVLPVVMGTILSRQRVFLMLMLFALPLTLVPLLVYTESGETNLTWAHIVSVAVTAALCREWLCQHAIEPRSAYDASVTCV